METILSQRWKEAKKTSATYMIFVVSGKVYAIKAKKRSKSKAKLLLDHYCNLMRLTPRNYPDFDKHYAKSLDRLRADSFIGVFALGKISKDGVRKYDIIYQDGCMTNLVEDDLYRVN